MAQQNRKQRKASRRRGAVVDISQYRENHEPQLRKVVPLTVNQHRVFQEFEDGQHVVMTGSAGTGKTFLAMYLALREGRRVIIIRSAVPVRSIGFTPGDVDEKMAPYEEPYKAIVAELYPSQRGYYDSLKRNGNISFVSTSFIRGVTLNHCVVIIEECQDLNYHECDSVITRLGDDARLIVTGDFLQSDFTRTDEKRGYRDFLRILDEMECFSIIDFNHSDIVRGNMMKEYIMHRDHLGIQP